MYPPIFSIVSKSAAVKSAFGTDPVRIYMFGLAPEGVKHPYAVWQIVGGSPENYLNETPDIDLFSVQIDVYGASVTAVRSGARALRDAIEPHAHVVSWRGESKDVETNLYRSSFDVDFWTDR